MRVLFDLAQRGQQAQILAVLLPGALQQPEEFVQAGIVEAVRRRGLALDLALVDVGLRFIGEATDGTALRQLHEQVMQPSLRRYRRLWMGGISIGGLMSLAYAARYPGLVEGLCLLAPYPGNRLLTGEIVAAGGPASWQAAQGQAAARQQEEDERCDERRAWRWLAAAQDLPTIHLGFGAGDRFAAGQCLMAQALPAGSVDASGGGHDWQTWRGLWDNFLDRNLALFDCAPRADLAAQPAHSVQTEGSGRSAYGDAARNNGSKTGKSE